MVSCILEMWIRNRGKEYLLYGDYTFQDIRDELFIAKYQKPKGRTFKDGTWMEMTVEVQKLMYIFGVIKPDALQVDISKKVAADLRRRRKKFGRD